MIRVAGVLGFTVMVVFFPLLAQQDFERDVITTSGNDIEISFIGHGTLMIEFEGVIVHVDPVGREAEYVQLPKADIVLITHHHGDHLDSDAVEKIRQKSTVLLCTELCAKSLTGATVMKNGDQRTVKGLTITAVPAYNLVHTRENGQPFHSKGEGNGYVIEYADTRIYVAGDTENTPEMKTLNDIDIAFLPMNLPYTMTPAMVADAATAFRPGILYPYHYGRTDLASLLALMKGEKGIEVRIRKF